jgi:hypothetical protein
MVRSYMAFGSKVGLKKHYMCTPKMVKDDLGLFQNAHK